MVTALERVIFFIPLLFFVLENVWMYLLTQEVDKLGLTLQILLLPLVTSFYFLTTSPVSFVILITLSIAVLITALFAERAERSKVFSVLMVIAGVLTLVEYYFLLR